MKNLNEIRRPVVRGAILLRSGEELNDPFDFWVYTEDFDDLNNAPDAHVIIMDTREEIEREIQSRHPAPEGCRYVQPERSELHLKLDEPQVRDGRDRRTWGRRKRYQRYKQDYHDGWKVYKYPVIDRVRDVTELRTIVIEAKYALIPSNRISFFDEKALRDAGFMVGTSHGFTKVWFNPSGVRKLRFRQTVKQVKDLLQPNLPHEISYYLAKALGVGQWPTTPWKHLIRDDQREPRTEYKRHKGSVTTYFGYGADEILAYLALAHKLIPGQTPWREWSEYSYSRYNGHSSEWTFKNILEKAVVYLHGLRANPDPDTQKLARWITREARIAGVEIPKKPKLPSKKGKKACRKPNRNNGMSANANRVESDTASATTPVNDLTMSQRPTAGSANPQSPDPSCATEPLAAVC